jgi:hypothetical protein
MGHDIGVVVIDNVRLEEVSPAAAASISIFTGSNDLAVEAWGADWGPESARIVDANIGDSASKLIELSAGKTFAGISFTSNPFDASSKTTFHMDYFIEDVIEIGQVVNVKLSNHAGNSGETSAIQTTIIPTVSGQWVTVSIPLANFEIAGGGSSSRANVAQIVFGAARANNGNPVKLHFKNMYLD